MPERNGLRALQMRVTAHHRALIFFRFVRQRGDERKDEPFDFFRRLAGEHPHIERDLVVPAARRVEFLPEDADPFGQRLLDERMDVFRRLVDFESAR